MAVELIPFYDLYGESLLNIESGFVHLENIAARSQQLDWEIANHRHDRLIQFIFVFDNTWRVRLDDKDFELQGNWLLVVPPGVVHGFNFKPNTHGVVLSVHIDRVDELGLSEFSLEANQIIMQPEPIELHSEKDIAQIKVMLTLITDELSSYYKDARFMLSQQLKLLMMYLIRQRQLESFKLHSTSRETAQLLKFRELVEQEYRAHWRIQDYADRLHLSASTLSRICQRQLKLSPKQVIQQRLHTEAKRRLIYTKQTLDEIALMLGYKDTGYFCRQFKAFENLTPSAYRKHNSV